MGFSVKRVFTACINTMHSWGLEMFWVILWRECLMFVQTLRTAEVWKWSELFCEDSAYCLCNHYVQLRPKNVLGCSVKTMFTTCTNTMQSWGLECSGLFCEESFYCLYKHYAELRSVNVLGYSVKRVLTACRYKHYAQLSGNVRGYSVKTVLTACTNTTHRWGLEIYWVILWRECLVLV